MPKTVNYTDDQVSKMIKAYQTADTDSSRKEAVQSLATDLGKTVKSVIAKLCREGVYIKATPVTKSGEAVVRKEDIVKNIASKLDLKFDDVKSLGKATKLDLETLLESLS